MSLEVSLKDVYSGCIVNLNENNKLFFFWIIVASNIIFFAYWGFKMADEFKGELIKKLGCLYIFCCLCGNKEKYELIKEKRRLMEDHEILREDFIDSLRELKRKVDNEELMLN